MTLDEFLASAPAVLEAFAAATRLRALTDPDMNPNREREAAWWWNDVAAYLAYTELEEDLRIPPGD